MKMKEKRETRREEDGPNGISFVLSFSFRGGGGQIPEAQTESEREEMHSPEKGGKKKEIHPSHARGVRFDTQYTKRVHVRRVFWCFFK